MVFAMRRFLGTAFFFLSAVIAYQCYQTSRVDPAVQEQSRRVACGSKGSAECAIQSSHLRSAELNSFGHRYGWATKGGEVWVNCRRQWLVIGPWSCELS